MSRFANIEFDDGRKEPQKPELKGTPIRDAAHFEAAADDFYLAGDFEQALRHYSRCLEHNAAWFNGWFGQVRMLIELGEYPEALMWSDKALQLFPENPDLLGAKAVASARNGQISKAMAFSDNALSRPNGTAYVWLARAEILAEQRKVAVEECTRNATGMAGAKAGIIRLEAGRILMRARRFATALEHLQAAIAVYPKSALAWYELARCQHALGQPQAATSAEQSLQLRPGWNEPSFLLKHIEDNDVFSRIRSWLTRK